MIRAVGKTFDGKPMLIVGLAPDDVRELPSGVMIDTADLGADLGPDTVILVWAAGSDEELQRRLTTEFLRATTESTARGAAHLRIHLPQPQPLGDQLRTAWRPTRQGTYLATCQDCQPILPQPFRTLDARNRWASTHTTATGHTVYMEGG